VEFSQTIHENTVEIIMKGSESVLKMMATDGDYRETGRWVEHIVLREERNRVESYFDDCYQPGYIEAELKPRAKTDFAIVAAAGASRAETEEAASNLPTTTSGCEDLYKKENSRIENLVTGFYSRNKSIIANDWLNWLIFATDSFIVRTVQSGEAVIAGYHWFESWGRDTFISLPGLTLVTGRFETAKNILVTFRNYCSKGLIPNFIDEKGGQPAYNTVDATLWFVNAVLQYVKYTDDLEFVRRHMWETLESIIENHVRGTDFGIRMDKDGLLSHGRRLTWMDAEFNGQAFTPREGKAVEIQALWYNALKIMQSFSFAFGEKDKSKAYGASAERTRNSFREEFWNEKKGCLYDVVGPDGKDGSVRPNQILAVSLDYPVLDAERAKSVIHVVQRDLLTPYGLRTLSKDDSGYIGGYLGDRLNRDKAYHNGAVWPWLLGLFVTAFLKIGGNSTGVRESARGFLMSLFAGNIPTGGLGSLNEVFDGDPPYAPRACISQAWSVAEPLRAYVEDVMRIRPKYESKLLNILR
jgi:predicted glycogen debranching enzyme